MASSTPYKTSCWPLSQRSWHLQSLGLARELLTLFHSPHWIGLLVCMDLLSTRQIASSLLTLGPKSLPNSFLFLHSSFSVTRYLCHLFIPSLCISHNCGQASALSLSVKLLLIRSFVTKSKYQAKRLLSTLIFFDLSTVWHCWPLHVALSLLFLFWLSLLGWFIFHFP